MIRTWQIEMSVVTAAALASAFLAGGRWTDFVSASAVVATFGHASVGERLRERQALTEKPEVECYQWLTGYYAIKELGWVVYFVSTRSYPALVGCSAMILYPFWRRFYRRKYPIVSKEAIKDVVVAPTL